MQKIVYIGVEHLHPHPDNPRKNLGDLTELAGSIKAKGVLQNLTVVPTEEEGEYRVIIGHRRHAAGKIAGLTELPCVVATMTPQEQFETMMVENVQRSDLTVYEQAEGFQIMLDMGSTVEQVAQKTGFSETTVRNRVKLMDLDKKKFQKAEKRGATLQDYLKLNKIKDPSRRNKVLDAIGTPEFNNALKSAVEEEATQAYMQKVRAAFENADWCQELPRDTQIHPNYTHVRAYNRWNTKDEVKRPEDADTVEYFYIVRNTEDISLYKRRDAAENEARNEVQEMRDKLKGALDNIKSKLTSISKRHLEIRDDFVHDFTEVHNYEMDIEAFAVKTMVFVGNISHPKLDNDRLGNLLGVSRGNDGKLDQGKLNSVLFNNPQYALLCTAYTLLEGEGQKYNGSGLYDTSYYGFPPKPEKNSKLDLIYEGLKSLGYEMSEEEIQMQQGTHPLYKKAQELIDAFKKAIGDGGEGS